MQRVVAQRRAGKRSGGAVIFDGSGVKWVAELADEGHKYHGLLEEVRDVVAGACVYCSRAYAVEDEVEAANIPFLDDFRGHPSLRSLVAGGPDHRLLTCWANARSGFAP